MVQPLDDARRRRTQAGSAVSRVPPHNLEAEESLLGAMLLSRDAIVSAVEIQLAAGDFYKPAHGHVFDAISSIYAQGEPADPVTVADELRRANLLDAVGGQSALVGLQANTPAIGNAGRYARIVEEHALLRRLIGVAGDIAEMGYSVPEDVAAAIDEAEAMVFDVAQRRVTDSLAPLRDLLERHLDHIEALYERGEDITGIPTGFIDLDTQLAGLQPSNLIIVGGRPGTGKALALATPIPTPTGWSTMGDLQVGDKVLDARGQPCRVTFATPVQYDRQCYQVVFDDGSTVVADADHQWFAYDFPASKSRRAAQYRAALPSRNPALARDQSGRRCLPRVVTTQQMLDEGILAASDGRPNWYIPLAKPLDLPEAPLPLDPYLLGVWLGDGHTGSAAITTEDDQIVAAFREQGFQARPVARAGAAMTYRISYGHATTKPWLQRVGDAEVREGRVRVAAGAIAPEVAKAIAARYGFARHDDVLSMTAGKGRPHADSAELSFVSLLRELGVLGSKHIPAPYMRASAKQRLALLQGVLDTDGHVEPSGLVDLCLSNEALLRQVRELVCSLGHKPGPIVERSIRLPGGRLATAWRFHWTPLDPVFRLERKAVRLGRATGRIARRAVTAIRPVPSEPVRCITVDSPDHLYLAGESMIPTHNTSFALGIVAHAALESRTPVLLFSLEMSHLELTQRLLCSEARVDATRMRNGRLLESDWPKISHAVGRLAEAPVFIDDNPHLTVMEIRAKARRLKSRSGGLGLIVIDYLQLMSGRSKAENRQVEVSEMSRGLKILARELEVPVIALSQLSRNLETRADKRPVLADLRESGCLPASTRIMRADNGEQVTLGELVLSQQQPLVWSVDDHQRIVPARLTRAFPSGVKPVFALRLASGRQVTATGNHRFLTIEGWRPLSSLQPGCFLAVPRRLPAPAQASPDWGDDELAFLAHMLGHGTLGPSLKYATADNANKNLVEDLARRLYGIRATGKRQGNTWQLWFPSPYRLVHGVHHPMQNWLVQLGLWESRAWTKFLPESLFGLHNTQIATFLHHLWATDGSITITRNNRGRHVNSSYATTSHQLALDVQRLLLRLGVRSTIGMSRKRRSGASIDGSQQYRLGYAVRVQGAASQAQFLRLVGCHGQRGECIPEALAILDGINAGSSEPADSATSDLNWDEVVEVSSAGLQPTFDATVQGTHNFMADGIVAHNSLEQDADVVIFLYRDEVYNRESPDRGTAEVIVAKHRNGPTGVTQLAFLDHYTRFANMARGV